MKIVTTNYEKIDILCFCRIPNTQNFEFRKNENILPNVRPKYTKFNYNWFTRLDFPRRRTNIIPKITPPPLFRTLRNGYFRDKLNTSSLIRHNIFYVCMCEKVKTNHVMPRSPKQVNFYPK